MDSPSTSLLGVKAAGDALGYWVNVDMSTRVAKIHRESCIWCRPYSQASKGVNVMKGGGGWFRFESPGEAECYCRGLGLGLLWIPCRFCRP